MSIRCTSGMAGENDAVRAEVLGDFPGVLGMFELDDQLVVGRPPEPPGGAERLAEARMEDIGRRFGGRIEGIEAAGGGERRALLRVQRIVEALADNGPVAEVFGPAPDEADACARDPRDAFSFAREELVGGSGYRTSPYTEAVYIRARKP